MGLAFGETVFSSVGRDACGEVVVVAGYFNSFWGKQKQTKKPTTHTFVVLITCFPPMCLSSSVLFLKI